jgi:endonuclease/exonuclease/phosphatase family metal-dependent hydrolase
MRNQKKCSFLTKTTERLLAFLLIVAGPAHAQTIKLSTWNLNWFTTSQTQADRPADAPHRTQADIAELRAYANRLDADIIALEEVDGATSAASLFPPDRYTIVTIHQNVAQQVGLAVRRPLTVMQNPDITDLDVEPARAPHHLRYGLDATVGFPDGAKLRILAVHLKTGCITDNIVTSRRPACALLSRQIPPLAAWLAARAAGPTPFALLGDFNRDFDQPESVAIPLQVAAPLVRVTEGASDPCWSTGPFIDHIFLGGDARAWLQPGSLRVLTYHSDNESDKDRLSDHCPVSVRLRPNQKKQVKAVVPF